MNAEGFWDRVFRERDAQWVADHPADYFFDIFALLGKSFRKEFKKAHGVLDIGPGYGRLLEASTAPVKWALEISHENRERLRGRLPAIIALAPDSTVVIPEGSLDLAWSVSCFPHCDYEMQKHHLERAYFALRKGGAFYLEHVALKPGAPDCEEGARLPAGRYHVEEPMRRDDLLGFKVSAIAIREINSPVVYGWVARLEKP